MCRCAAAARSFDGSRAGEDGIARASVSGLDAICSLAKMCRGNRLTLLVLEVMSFSELLEEDLVNECFVAADGGVLF